MRLPSKFKSISKFIYSSGYDFNYYEYFTIDSYLFSHYLFRSYFFKGYSGSYFTVKVFFPKIVISDDFDKSSIPDGSKFLVLFEFYSKGVVYFNCLFTFVNFKFFNEIDIYLFGLI